ncbi:hypothetical protein KZX50_09835 [Bacillus infantis]|uniref:hypothetical protein n=1 Tax=Bacillus infantis TaxID=324767 RepID=UPI00200426C8|nr:hypothetical protein [Bacillus infantis]MCK6205736.1 hypothetical protein [Bacillus infantis]
MRIQLFIFPLIALFFLTVTGCSNGIENDKQKILVQQHSGIDNKYDNFKEINNSKQVQKVKKILNEADWNNTVVSMSRPADYQFFFNYKDKSIQSDAMQHLIWISPTKDKLEVVRGNDAYMQLTEQDSAILYNIITGTKLSDVK